MPARHDDEVRSDRSSSDTPAGDRPVTGEHNPDVLDPSI